jgi:hypothetical protein
VKRLLVLAAACLLPLALLGCAPGDDAALTVNGDEVLTVGELQDQLDGIGADEDFMTTFDARGAGSETLTAGFVTSVLSNHVLTNLLEAELEAQDVEVTEEDISTGTEQLAGAVGGPVETVPAGYRETLIDLFSYATALKGSLGGDEQALQDRITELLADADVEVDQRYGSWDPETSSVVAPEGPVVVSTTIPVATVPAG